MKSKDGATAQIGADGSVVVKEKDGTVATSSSKGDIVVTSPDGKTTTVTSDGNKVEATTSDGKKLSMNSGTVTEEDLGIPFYPGSSHQSDMKMDGSAAMSSRKTTDPIEKVEAFYKDKIKDNRAVSSTDGPQKTVMMIGDIAGGKVQVMLASQTEGGTTISITKSLTKP
ncbi:MAG: hypothetical protein MUC92_07675 [Fimbriimonadaceae bacterium]|nr:hypothetical protein [Fimbriimonadaceae bacterium]